MSALSRRRLRQLPVWRATDLPPTEPTGQNAARIIWPICPARTVPASPECNVTKGIHAANAAISPFFAAVPAPIAQPAARRAVAVETRAFDEVDTTQMN